MVHVLVVIERPLLRTLVVDTLAGDGIRSTTVSGADEVVGAQERLATDALIVDGVAAEELQRWGFGDCQAVPVLVVDDEPTVPSVQAALRLGVFDYCDRVDGDLGRRVLRSVNAYRSASVDDLERLQRDLERALQRVEALRGVARSPTDLSDLSGREREILPALLRGRSASEVGEELFISPHTVRNHMKSIYKKLDVSSHLELLALFVTQP